VTGVQGTVATFDPGSGAGSVLLDDGTPVEFGTAAFAASGLRLLRIGQRIRLTYDQDGRVAAVSLITMPAV
jgi:2-phospho-L-lactate guanylyltransferase